MFAWYCVMQVLDGLLSYYHGHILAKQVAYVKALGRNNSIFSQRERNCGNERRKCLVTTYIEKGTRAQTFESELFFTHIIVLKICFSCLHFFIIFCHLSDYFESTLFHVGSNPFEIQPSLWQNDLGKRYGIVRLYSNSNNNDDDDDNDCLITIMIVAPCWARFLCFLVP